MKDLAGNSNPLTKETPEINPACLKSARGFSTLARPGVSLLKEA